MRVRFHVLGLPPKKDGANSMWNKRSEFQRLRALRVEALHAMQGHPLRDSPLRLVLHVYAAPAAGDLDNFITGVCDGLMAATPDATIDPRWADLPEAVQPAQAIAFTNDKWVTKIEAERVPLATGGEEPHYEVELEWL